MDHAHHVTFWATQGGETNINDLALARERDHLLLHHCGLDIEIHHGVVYWIPPAWQDPERKPLRNTAHDPPRSNTS